MGYVMRIEQLQYVVAVADTHSLTLASEQLFVSRQNISKAIKQLEEELQVKIFQRSKHGTFLTPKGQKLYYYSRDVLDKVAVIENEFCSIQSYDSLLNGVLTLNAHTPLKSLLSTVIKKFKLTYPAVHISVNTQFDLYNEIESDSIYCISYIQCKLQDLMKKFPKHDFWCLEEEISKILINKSHVLANQTTVSLKSLYQYPIVLFRKDGSVLEDLFYEEGLKPNIYLRTDDYNYALELVGNGDAYCFGSRFVSPFMEDFLYSKISLVPLNKKIVLMHLLVLPEANKMTMEMKAFLEIVKQYYPKMYMVSKEEYD